MRKSIKISPSHDILQPDFAETGDKMISENWKSLFESPVLTRGRAYYHGGYVTKLTCTPDWIRAVVLGSEAYEVDIELDNGEIFVASCSCPYASENGCYCKHMAAVLYAAEEDPVSQTNVEASWQDTLEKMTREQMRDFLELILSGDTGLQERLVLGYGENPDPEMLQDAWEEQLSQIVDDCRDGYRYINYRHADEFYSAMNSFIEDRFPVLFSSGRILPAFNLVCTVFCTAMAEEADDSDGGMSIFMKTCADAWSDLVSAGSSSQRDEMYNWFYKEVRKPHHSFGEEAIERFLFGYAWDEAHLKKNLSLLDKLIQPSGDSKYRMESYLRWYEHTMQALHKTDGEIDAFWHKYWSYDFVRDREYKRFLEKEEYGKAIELLQEKSLSTNEPYRLNQTSKKLIYLYRITGQEQNYRQELLHQIETYPQTNMTYIQELRSIEPSEKWDAWTEQLLKLPTTKELRLELLAYNEAWPRLFAEIAQREQFSLLERYMDSLMGWNPEETIKCCCDCLNREMNSASDRNMYRNVFHRMALLKGYPGGQTVINSLLTLWQETYPRKSAMLDEMKKARKEKVI